MAPDERILRAHLEAGPFQSGVARGRWRLIGIEWPHVVIAVAAAPCNGGPDEYALRFECSDYPQTPPTAQPWDPEQAVPLAPEKRPTGHPQSRVAMAFRIDWNDGRCLYLPCDRGAIVDHGGWRAQHPAMIWSPTGDITQYLRIVHELLTSSDYTGPRRT